MKNIEKIAIDALTTEFIGKNMTSIESCLSMKAAAETAQANFKKAAQPLLSTANELANSILSDGISDDAISYLEVKLSEALRLPFKTKQN